MRSRTKPASILRRAGGQFLSVDWLKMIKIWLFMPSFVPLAGRSRNKAPSFSTDEIMVSLCSGVACLRKCERTIRQSADQRRQIPAGPGGQRLSRARGRRGTALRIAGEQPRDVIVQFGRHIRTQGANVRRGVRGERLQLPQQGSPRMVAACRTARQQEEERRTQSEQVGPQVERLFPLGLLGSHVVERAKEPPQRGLETLGREEGQLRQAE